jgi:hypothetical protein
MDDARRSDLEALRGLRQQALALSEAIRDRFEPIARRLARQGHGDAGWLYDELRACRTAPDSGTLATVERALRAVLEAE